MQGAANTDSNIYKQELSMYFQGRVTTPNRHVTNMLFFII